MASSQSQSQPQLSHLAQLRALAQHHLSEIEADKTAEQLQLTQAEIEIQRYAKMGSLDRKKLQQNHHGASIQSQLDQLSPAARGDAASTDDHEQKKKGRFRPFSDILHRLQWDELLNIDDYVVGYLERFEGIKEMPAKSWERDFSEEEWIPMHRVRYVKRVKRLGDDQDHGPALGMVWDRDQRIDRIFRSEGNSVDRSAQQPEDLVSVDGTSVTGGVAI